MWRSRSTSGRGAVRVAGSLAGFSRSVEVAIVVPREQRPSEPSQNERDYSLLLEAVKSGRLAAATGL